MKQHLRFTASLAAALAFATLNTYAASLWWDPVPDTAGPGDGAGRWGNAADNLNWWDGAANVPWNPGDVAVFGVNSNTAVTVTITNKVAAGGIIFSNAGTAAYTVIGGAANNLGLALGTNLTIAGVSPTILLAAHDVSHVQAVDIVSASVIAPNGLSVRAATTSTNGFVRLGHATNYIVGDLSIGTPGNTTYGGTTALYCDFNTPTDSAAVGINFVMTGATNVTVHSNATLRISNQNSSQWNPPFPKNLTLSGDGRNGMSGAWVITGNGNGIFNGNVILAGDSTIEINSGTAGRVYTLNQPITGTGRLQIVCGSAGKHTIQLTNASTYTGNTIIAGGTTLRLQSGNNRLPATTALTLGAQAAPVVNWNREGSLILGNATAAVNQTLAGLQSDAGGLNGLCRIVGGNTTNLSWLTISSDTLNEYAGAVGGNATADRNLGLLFNGGALILAGTNIASGGFTVSAGVLQFGDGFTDYPLTGPITNQGTVVFSTASAVTHADVITGAGSVVKRAGGALTLSGALSYAGTTTVESGKLTLPTTKTGAGAINVSSSANLEVRRTALNTFITAASSALDGARLDFGFNNQGLNATAPLQVTGNLANSGFTTLYIAAPGGLAIGSYPLIKYGSYTSNAFSSFSLGMAINPRVTASIQDNPATKSIDLVITEVDFLKWTGSTDGNWDTFTPNWILSSSGLASTYGIGDFARFDDSAPGTTSLTIVSDPQPGLVVVTNQGKDYTFGGFSGIGGGGGIIKQGTGKLTLANYFNNYTGGTVIQGGTLQVGDGVTDATLPDGVENNAALVFNVASVNAGNAITGTGSVAKTGIGALTLGGISTYSGATTVSDGSLHVASSTALGTAASGTTVPAGAELWVDNPGLNIPEPLNVAGAGLFGIGAAFNAAGTAAGSAWSGPITATPGTIFSAASGASIALSGGVDAASGNLEFRPNNAGYFVVSSTLNAGSLLVNDSGGVILSAANDSLTNLALLKANPTSGSISPTAGLIGYNHHAFGTNCSITVSNADLIGNSGAILRVGNNVSIPAGVSADFYVPGDGASGPGAYRATFGTAGGTSTNIWNGPVRVHGADPLSGYVGLFIVRPESAQLTLNGDLTLADGVATLFLRGGSASTVINGHINFGTNLLSTTADGGAGLVTVNSTGNTWGDTALNTTTLRLGANNAMPVTTGLQLQNASGTLELNGFNQQIGGLTGSGVVVNHSASAHATLTLAGSGDWTFGGALVLSGVFGSKQFGLDLAGGKLTLTSTANSYAGPTVVRNGATLALSGVGRIQGSDIEVQTGGTFDVSGLTAGAFLVGSVGGAQTISGNGTVIGTLTNNGTLAPGSSIGTLTVTGDVISGTTGQMRMEVNNAAATKDLLEVSGVLTYGGTLTIANVSATPYTVNQVIKLFNAATYAGAFDTVVFPGVSSYDASQLTVDGTIKVLAVIPTTPTDITVSVSNGEMTLSWPASYTGWRLETQTNSLNVGLSNNWVTVPGSTTVNTVTLPINAASGAVFYRLVYP